MTQESVRAWMADNAATLHAKMEIAMQTRRAVLMGAAALPIAVAEIDPAKAEAAAAPSQAEPEMFHFVWDFNIGREDWVVIGAFTKREDAIDFCARRPKGFLALGEAALHDETNGYAVAQRPWDFAIEQELQSRLGMLGDALAALGLKAGA